jgi:hypothetical protein
MSSVFDSPDRSAILTHVSGSLLVVTNLRTVVMGVDEIRVDLLSLDDFNQRLGPRLDEAYAALAALTVAPGTVQPALGTFQDAQQTSARHQNLRDEYVARLRRLVDAVTTAQIVATTIAARYRTVVELNQTSTEVVRDALSGGE